MLNFRNVNIVSVLCLIVLFILKTKHDISIIWMFLIVIAWLTLTIIGSFHIRWNYFLKSIHKNSEINNNTVAITFDDGPNAKYTERALHLLEKYKAKATFFMIGKHILKHPELLNVIITKGHTIGNHSYCHSNDYGFKSTKAVVEDIEKNQLIIQEITNLNLKFFRPPFGVTNPNIAKAIKKLNLLCFGWTVRSFDTTDKVVERIIIDMTTKIKPGDIILLHDTSEKSLRILEELLIFLEKNNLKSVTLDKLFNYKAYEN